MLNYSANGPSGYNLTNSLRLRNSASAYLTRTATTAPTDGKKLTLSCWVKRGILTGNYYIMQSGAGVGNDNYSGFYFQSNNTLVVSMYSVTPRITTQVFRDPSAWYHLVLAYDTTQATASDRAKLYVNGVQITSFTTNGTIPQNTLIAFTKQSQAVYIGTASDEATYFDGYMTEFNLIDGQALTPSSFGNTNSTTGVWQPAKYTGAYGTNGFYLKFADTSAATAAAIGKDSSGNGNNWTPSGISVTAGTTYDAMLDVPTLTSATVANYATLNTLTFAGTVSEANLRAASAGTDYKILGTLGVSSGKWYWEFIANNAPGGDVYGVANLLTPTSPTDTTSLSVAGTFARVNTGTQWYENGSLLSKTISTLSAGGIIQFALDVDNQKIWVGINGTWQASGDPAAGTNPISSNLTSGQTWFPYLQFRSATSNISANFGQRPFTYTPPTGFNAWNTYNLPTPTILQGNKYMDATLYTGTNVSNAIVNQGQFKPDLVWIKARSVVSYHGLIDSVRGRASSLFSNATDAEGTSSATQDLVSFNSNGFTVGVGSQFNSNGSGNTLVGWQWQANQGSTVSNTSGSITSTVSVNTTAGFSIATFTGTGANATVGHGLGVAPKMIIVKGRGNAYSWPVWHNTFNVSEYIYLNGTFAKLTFSNIWNQLPTSTTIGISGDVVMNQSAVTYVAYCWAEIAGFSKFGSYTGNASTDGPFVYTGFRPKFVMIKRTDSTGSWFMVDTSRNTYNLTDLSLYANLTDAEGASASHCIDILSNGFKCKGVGTNINASGGTYIYMAFAENPFKNALAR